MKKRRRLYTLHTTHTHTCTHHYTPSHTYTTHGGATEPAWPHTATLAEEEGGLPPTFTFCLCRLHRMCLTTGRFHLQAGLPLPTTSYPGKERRKFMEGFLHSVFPALPVPVFWCEALCILEVPPSFCHTTILLPTHPLLPVLHLTLYHPGLFYCVHLGFGEKAGRNLPFCVVLPGLSRRRKKNLLLIIPCILCACLHSWCAFCRRKTSCWWKGGGCVRALQEVPLDRLCGTLPSAETH